MVRQDKITYLNSCFDWQEKTVQFPTASPLAGLIGLLLADELLPDSDSMPYQSAELLVRKFSDAESSKKSKSVSSAGLSESIDRNVESLIDELLIWMGHLTNGSLLDFLETYKDDELVEKLLQLGNMDRLKARYFACAFLKREILPVNAAAGRVLIRFGIVPKFNSMAQLSKHLNPYIPYGRHFFMWHHLNQHAETVCLTDTPLCEDCCLSEFCDFLRKTNQWAES